MDQMTLWKDELYPEDAIVIDMPLTSKVDPLELREELELPEYIDLDYFPMKKCLTILWASKHAHELHEMFPDVLEKKICKKPINVCFFGGAAFKLHCYCSNLKKGPFFRHLNDLDLIVSRKRSGDLKKLLLKLGNIYGTQYLHFMTPYERRFTALQAGKRVFLRTFNEIKKDGTPRIGVMDILTDKIEMCHTINVKEELKAPKANNYTIGLPKLLLTKAQFIMEISKEKAMALQEGDNYRLLQCYDTCFIGMERKDFKDVAALLLDHQFGKGDDELDLEQIIRALERDHKLSLTVRLNLLNMLNNIDAIRSFGATENQIRTIKSRLEILLKEIPHHKVTKRKKPWWNTFVEDVPLPRFE